MKIKIASDIHADIWQHPAYNLEPYAPDLTDIDVFIIPGDAGQGLVGYEYSKRLLGLYPNLNIVHVAGNHEFYRHNLNKLCEKLDECNGDRYYFLDDDHIVIQGIKFIGATLWTDFNNRDELHMWQAEQRMNDYRQIRVGHEYRRLRAIDTYGMHVKSVDFINKELQKDDIPCIVVTHHKPYIGGEKGELRYAYESDVKLDKWPKFWFYGHTHHWDNKYDMEKDCHFMANCVGYPCEATGFDPERTIQI